LPVIFLRVPLCPWWLSKGFNYGYYGDSQDQGFRQVMATTAIPKTKASGRSFLSALRERHWVEDLRLNHQGHEVPRRALADDFPSCSFVSLVVIKEV
jgi:hypothetical protein